MTLTRRRFLAISAAALVGAPVQARTNRLSFRALGADCSLTLPGSAGEAAHALASVQDEIRRIEAAFSLYDPESELSRLNRDWVLRNPSQLFHGGLTLARLTWGVTNRAFDVTVQSLWDDLAAGRTPDYRLVGMDGLRIGRRLIRFERPGMAVTFNGFAQGLAADAAAMALSKLGYLDVLINLGEFAGAGVPERGRYWQIGVANPVSGDIVETLTLGPQRDAIATSAPRGTMIAGHPHVFDPLNRPGERWASVTVRAAKSGPADALSTAIAAAPMQDAEGILTRSVMAREAVLIPENGEPVRWRMRRG